MKDFLEILEKFVLDVIGTVIPGAIFLTGLTLCCPAIARYANSLQLEKFPTNALLIGIAYAIGHGLSGFGECAVVRPFDAFLKRVRSRQYQGQT